MTRPVLLADAAATERAGAAVARIVQDRGAVVLLHGELGAGKTTLVRGLLRTLGVTGAVRSPTYTLVEPYEAAGRRILHVDLYRLTDGAELDGLGIRESFDADTLVLVEWPERAGGAWPLPDLDLTLAYAASGRTLVAAGPLAKSLSIQ